MLTLRLTMSTLHLLAVALLFAATDGSGDTDERCGFWAERGECDANPRWMRTNCVASCESYDREKDASLANNVAADDEVDYGEGVGVDGTPFHLEAVLARSEAAETCLASGTPPPIVRLPDDYPAKLTLAPPLGKSSAEPTLDDLHAAGRLTFAEYVRPNHDTSKKMSGGAVAVKVLNFRRRKFKKMWDNGSADGVYNGELPAKLGARSVLMTYAGHAFKFVDADSGELYRRIVMKDNVHFIIFEPDADDDAALSSEAYAAAKREQQFMKQYYESLGYPWLSKYGRPTPVLNMWPADYIGQTHTIETSHGQWVCDDPSDEARCGPPVGSTPATFNLTVVSRAPSGPRVFVIPDLMSEAECDHIRRLGEDVVGESRVGQGSGGFKSSSRTSSTGWLSRKKSPILDAMHSRFADVLGLSDPGLSLTGEQLQVVRYRTGEEYNPHYDFSDSGERGYGQRFLTLLLYVEVPEKGGHTSFPKAFNGKGLKIKPPTRGGAVLFYSMLPDGNGDDLSLHGGDAVNEGEKWVCNLWVWDPNRNS